MRYTPIQLKIVILFCLLFCPAVILFSQPAEARITNTQDRMFSIDKDGLYLHSDFSLNWTTGTADIMQFLGDLGGEWLKEPHLLFLTASGSFAKKDEARFLNQYFGHLRYRYRIWQMVMAEIFAQGEFNEFRRILFRTPFGIGPRIQVNIGKERLFQLSAGTSYMFEMVHLSKDVDGDGDPYEDNLAYEYNHRWSSYLAFKLNLPVVSLGATTYIQPKFNDFSDWMCLIESNISFNVTEQISIALSYTLFHDSSPPAGVIRQDTALNAVLKIAFGPLLGDAASSPTSDDVKNTPSK